jgi:hypothetical protein
MVQNGDATEEGTQVEDKLPAADGEEAMRQVAA